MKVLSRGGPALIYPIEELFLLLCKEQMAGVKGRSRMTQQEAIATIRAGSDGGLDRRGSRGCGER